MHRWITLGLGVLLAACGQAPQNAPPRAVQATTQLSLRNQASSGPTVVATVPANGAAAVNPLLPIQLTFSQAMERSSETAFGFFSGVYDPGLNPARYSRLRLTSRCDGRWRVRNANDQAISFSWEVYKGSEKGLGVVPPNGEAFFYTSSGPHTVRVFMGDERQDIKASSPHDCPARAETFAWNPKSTTLSVKAALAEEASYTGAVSTLATSAGGGLASPYAFSFTTLRLPGCPAGPSPTRTFQIEGSGASSPLVGQVVTTEGVVVGDYQEANQLRGFFLQDFTGDNDPSTSDGLFVFTPSGFPVNTGDYVQVTGTVREFASSGDTGGTLTQLDTVSALVVCASGTSVSATPVALPLTNTGDLERYEGMLVSFPQTLTVSEVFNLGRFGEISLSVNGRLFQPNNGNGLGDTAMGNPLRRILLDDASNTQNPSPIPYLSASDTSGTRRIGDTVTNLTGVLSYGFSSYRVEPVGAVNFVSSNPRPLAPENVGGSLKVASYNVLNYFTTFGSRGANNQAEFDRQKAKLVAALQGLDADVVGLIEIQNNGETALNDLVNALNAALGAGTYASVQTGTVGSDEIRVAIIYKPAKVTPEGAFRVDNDPVYSRPPVAQTFRDKATQGRFTVVVNHFKSKGCDRASGAEADTGQGCWNALRVQQAQQLLTFINDLRATDPDVLAVGDLNAYAEEDPLKVLTGAGLENLILRSPAAKRYSYVFNGESGNLDHALVTSSLSSQVTGITEWHINSDEPRVLDYNTEFKPDDRYAPTPFRSSDHDPLLIGLNLSADPTPADFSLAVSDAGPSVQAGQSMNLTVTVTPINGFSGNVDLSLNPSPAEISSSFTPATLSAGASSTLSLNVDASVTPKTYPFTITGTSGGLTRTARFVLTVTAPPSASCVRISQV